MPAVTKFEIPVSCRSFSLYTRLPLELRQNIMAAYLSQAGINFLSIEARDKKWNWETTLPKRHTAVQGLDSLGMAIESDMAAPHLVLCSDLVPTASFMQADISNSVRLRHKMNTMKCVGREARLYMKDLASRPGVLRLQIPGRNDIVSLASSQDVTFLDYITSELYASDSTLDLYIDCPGLDQIRRVAVRLCHDWRPACSDSTCSEYGKPSHGHEQGPNYPLHLFQFLARCFPRLEQVWLVDYHATRNKTKGSGNENEHLRHHELDSHNRMEAHKAHYDAHGLVPLFGALTIDEQDDNEQCMSPISSSSFNDSGFFEASFSDSGMDQDPLDGALLESMPRVEFETDADDDVIMKDYSDDHDDRYTDALEYLDDKDFFVPAAEKKKLRQFASQAPRAKNGLQSGIDDIVHGMARLSLKRETGDAWHSYKSPRQIFHAEGRRYYEVRRNDSEWNITPRARHMCDWLQNNFLQYAKQSTLSRVQAAETVEFGILACKWDIEPPAQPKQRAAHPRHARCTKGAYSMTTWPVPLPPDAMDLDSSHVFGSGSLDTCSFGFPMDYIEVD
ncbi:hypothetical protein CDD81_1529 [Ophiocordyceps australis]|uniref:Uncharacterized protein n=1 Tax=Ophiocordyceps australis TaxID=1399860 RepID=A0A2C5YEU7_9HYPO|nr:hypothetical protein CDD81_1529 [Ophiocordyceps australis]